MRLSQKKRESLSSGRILEAFRDIRAYNFQMPKLYPVGASFVFFLSSFAVPQAKPAAASPQSALERGVGLAEGGHCEEALPLLKKSLRQISDKDIEKRAGLDGLHCAM